MHLPYVEFYITNVCNFNCRGCNRFNNYAFAGSQRWQDHADTYRAWSERLDFDRCTILGGEPMAVSDYMDWLRGIRELWPTRPITFLSNGSLLRPTHRELYDFILKDQGLTTFSIGLHNRNRVQEVLDAVSAWMVGAVKITRGPEDLAKIENSQKNWRESYEKIRDPAWPNCDTWLDWDQLPEHIRQECSEVFAFDPDRFADRIQYYYLTDSQGVSVTVTWESDFHQGALIADHVTGRFRLHNSDPDRAHAVCHSKTCHHFESGKLYKCGQVSLFPQFYQQFFLDLDPADLDLVNSYVPATIDMSDQALAQWIDQLDQPMPQCKFCPESYQMTEVFAGPKKISFPKRKKVDQ